MDFRFGISIDKYTKEKAYFIQNVSTEVLPKILIKPKKKHKKMDLLNWTYLPPFVYELEKKDK